jgi:hypothetical protein
LPRNVSTGGVKGGDFYKKPYESAKSYEKSETKKLRTGSKFFRNFARTKTKSYMTAYNDIHYLSVIRIALANIDDGGNVEAAFDNVLDVAWEIGAKTGNIKDLDATQETAMKNWFRYWLKMVWDIAAQMMLRPFVPAFTESSTTASSTTACAIWKQADWDAFLQSLEKLDCPDFVYKFMQPFLFTIKMSEGYEKAGLPIPPSYVLPITHNYELSDMQTLRESAKGVSAQAMTHCKKFGIPFSKFSTSKLEAKELSRSGLFNNQDIVAYFSIIPIRYYNNTPALTYLLPSSGCYAGGDLTTEYEAMDYTFIDGKHMSILHALAPIVNCNYTYDGTNSPYVNIITCFAPDNNEYEVSIFHTSLLGTSWTAGTVTSLGSYHVLSLIRAWYNAGSVQGMAFTGSKVTADQTLDTQDWIAAIENPDICLGTGVKGAEVNDQLVNAFKYMIYGD